jgi:hypothetical protein
MNERFFEKMLTMSNDDDKIKFLAERQKLNSLKLKNI